MYCTYCGSKKHTITNCPKTWAGSVNHERLYCGYCGGHDHTINTCLKTWSGASNRRSGKYENEYVLDK